MFFPFTFKPFGVWFQCCFVGVCLFALFFFFFFFSSPRHPPMAFLGDGTEKQGLTFRDLTPLTRKSRHKYSRTGFYLRMPTSSAVFYLLTKNQNEVDDVTYTAITAARVLSQLLKFRNDSKHSVMYLSEENLSKGRGFSQQSKVACCQKKRESNMCFLLIFLQKEQREAGSRIFQKKVSKERQQQHKQRSKLDRQAHSKIGEQRRADSRTVR